MYITNAPMTHDKIYRVIKVPPSQITRENLNKRSVKRTNSCKIFEITSKTSAKP